MIPKVTPFDAYKSYLGLKTTLQKRSMTTIGMVESHVHLWKVSTKGETDTSLKTEQAKR